MSKVLLEKKARVLNGQIEVLINSVADYMERAKFGLQEAKKFQRINFEKLNEERLDELESAFKSLKDIFVFGDIEEKIPTLIDGVRELLEKKE